MSVRYSAGIATAYGAAVRGGYTGTYEEWCALMADYATVGEAAAASAAAAAGSATAAATSASSAKDYMDTAEEYSDDALGYSTQAGSRASAAAQSATAANGSANNAAASATAAAGSATNAANSATAAAASAAEAKAVEESIPEDYSELSTDVVGLKSAFGNIFNDTEVHAIIPAETRENKCVYVYFQRHKQAGVYWLEQRQLLYR